MRNNHSSIFFLWTTMILAHSIDTGDMNIGLFCRKPFCTGRFFFVTNFAFHIFLLIVQKIKNLFHRHRHRHCHSHSHSHSHCHSHRHCHSHSHCHSHRHCHSHCHRHCHRHCLQLYYLFLRNLSFFLEFR